MVYFIQIKNNYSTKGWLKMKKIIKRMLVSFIISYIAARATSFFLKEDKTESMNK